MAGFGLNLPPAVKAAIGRGAKPNAGPRQSAIAHHMGAPKQRPAKPVAKPKAAAPPKAAPRPAAKGLGSSQKAIGELNQGDVVNRARTEARLARNQELVPLKAQAAEIKGNEQGVQQRYGQLVGAQNTQLEKLQQGQEASAKTFQNQMAENALTQGKAIETAGQTQASMTGGYVSPELRAQQALSSQQAAGQGGAGSAFAQQVAAGGANEIAQMRAAASLSALGGSQAVSNTFQKQLAQNQTAQQGVFAKTGLREVEGRTKLEQANFADQAAKAKLGSEGIKLQQAGAKIRQAGELGRAKIGASERASTRTRESAKESAAASREGHQLTAASQAANRELKKYQEAHPSAAKSKGLTTKETDSFISSLTSGFQKVGHWREGAGAKVRAGKEGPKQRAQHYAEIRKKLESGERTQQYEDPNTGETKTRVLKEGHRNTTIATAAIELWNTHKVSQSTRIALKHGMGIELPDDATLYRLANGG